MDERLTEVLERTRVVYESARELDDALQGFVEALVPGFSDAVSLITFEPGLDPDDPTEGVLVRVPAEAWVEPERAEAVHRLGQRVPELFQVTHPVMAALARPAPQLVVDCPELSAMLGREAPEELELVARVQTRSALTMPLLRRGLLTGVLVFGHTEASGRRFGEDDLPVARELALRCSAVLETHRLRQRLARALGDSERHRLRLEHLIDAMPDGFSLISRDLRYLQVNQSRARLHGLRPADMISQPIGRFAGELTGLAEAAVRYVVESGEVVRGREVQVRDGPSGEVRHLLVDLYPVRDGDEVLAVGSLLRDITERVADERRRQELEEELAAARRLETVGQLAGGVAHDFNNILAVIGLRAELLARQRPGDGDLRADVETVLRAVGQGRALADQLLWVGRAQPAPRQVVEVDRLLGDLAPVLEALLGEGVALDLVLDGAPPVEVAPSALQQAILNLVVNGRDAMADGGVLTVTSRRVARQGREGCELRVTDTGPGMPAEVRDRAFEPFFSTKAIGAGAGLGLATVYGTAQGAGGQAWIESPPGGGCTVAVWLPAATAGAAVVATGGWEALAPVAAAPGGRGQVLVVEDQPDVAAATAEVLADLGFEPLPAADAPAALALAASADRLVLVIADVIMPGRSGPDLVRELRASRPGLPVLYVSGFTQRAPGAGDGVGEGELLRKPFTAAELAARVHALVG